GRYWGDIGFIHLCFDIQGMDALKATCEAAGFPFTVDSANSFDMGEAAGRFSYIEDPDGTLIEFVETHRVPILKKIGWYLNLRNKPPGKSLPRWMLRAMGLNRVKEWDSIRRHGLRFSCHPALDAGSRKERYEASAEA